MLFKVSLELPLLFTLKFGSPELPGQLFVPYLALGGLCDEDC
jgi:hypothetical protein